jgi:hypothetical protein
MESQPILQKLSSYTETCSQIFHCPPLSLFKTGARFELILPALAGPAPIEMS